MGSREQTGVVLRLIDRTVTLMAEASGVNNENDSRIVEAEVIRLTEVCDLLLANAFEAYDLNIDGGGIRLTIHDAMQGFIASQPMASLSSVNKMKVINQACGWYEIKHAELLQIKERDRRDSYVERTYDALKASLHMYASIINDTLTAVVELNQVCESLLSIALSAQRDLSDIEGKRIADNIPNAMNQFSNSTPMVSLSPVNKMYVLDQAYESYDLIYENLRQVKGKSIWDVYKERAYRVLKTTLRVMSEQIRIKMNGKGV